MIRNHRRAAYDAPSERVRGALGPADAARPADHGAGRRCSRPRTRRGTAPWPAASCYGYRNAQTTLLAPTGTIGLLMDCDTTGVEPDFALVKFKKLAGGGYFKIANQCIEPALRTSATAEQQRTTS